jgi:Zn-dependent protease with chaperone function
MENLFLSPKLPRLSLRRKDKGIIDPPPRNAFRKKWANLIAFVILDLFQILIISSVRLDFRQTNYKIFNIIDLGIEIRFEFNPAIFLVFILIIYLLRSIIGNYILMQMFKKPKVGMYQIFPTTLPLPDDVDSRIFSRVPSAKINKWVSDIADEMGIGDIEKVFLAKTAIPNAYTIELSAFPFIPFIRKRNYVVLNSNIFQILNEEEIKCVISHELAHIKNHDSSLRLILSGPHLFLQAAYLYFYILILTGISNAVLIIFNPVQAIVRTTLLITIMILATIISDLTIGFLRKSNQMAELQADLEPLRIIGFKPTLNTLIKLGQRTEVLESLKNETIWLEKQDIYRGSTHRAPLVVDILEKFPETEIDDLKVLHELPRLYLEKLLQILRECYYLDLNIDGIEERLDDAAKKLFEKRKQEIDSRIKTEPLQTGKKSSITSRRVMIDWRDFDLDLDFNLEVEEIQQFVKALEKNPTMLFKNEITDIKSQEKNHPSFRTRVLFVYHVAEEWGVI